MLLPLFFLLNAPQGLAQRQLKQQKIAKNVIFFIGDGMGCATITGARIWAYGSEGSLNLEKFPVSGLVKTYSSSDYVTDSAASGTALASGIKTYNGAIGLTDPAYDPTKKPRKLETLLNLAKKLGKSVGVVSTAKVTDATPASFYAHVKKRYLEDKIAQQLEYSSVDLILGGGRSQFFPPSWSDPVSGKPGLRDDKLDLIARLMKRDWVYVKNKKELWSQDLKKISNKKIIGLFHYDHMTYDLERRQKQISIEPSLSEMVEFAVDRLSKNKNGFFLVVEGGRIDHAAHVNDAENVFSEVIAFDKSIGIARKLTSERDTLFVITADHETGGLSLSGYKGRKETRGRSFLGKEVNFSNPNRFLVSFATGPHHPQSKKYNVNKDHPALYYAKVAAHTASDVPILALGPKSELFSGFMSNEEVAWKIAKAMNTRFERKANIENHRIIRSATQLTRK